MNDLVREMHHCVRNNLQIIASLINLQKRSLPAGRRGEMRFVEEHVQSMAVVYRVAETRGSMRVPLDRLVVEVADNLRYVARLPREALSVKIAEDTGRLEQQRAIALALLLAAVLPPYLDFARSQGMALPIVVATEPDQSLTISIAADQDTITLEPLRSRLTAAYLRQLSATSEPSERGVRMRFPIDA